METNETKYKNNQFLNTDINSDDLSSLIIIERMVIPQIGEVKPLFPEDSIGWLIQMKLKTQINRIIR
jgi:hypothetical protein